MGKICECDTKSLNEVASLMKPPILLGEPTAMNKELVGQCKEACIYACGVIIVR